MFRQLEKHLFWSHKMHNEFKTMPQIEEEITEEMQQCLNKLNAVIDRAATYDIGITFGFQNITKDNDKVIRNKLTVSLFKLIGSTRDE